MKGSFTVNLTVELLTEIYLIKTLKKVTKKEHTHNR